MEGTIEESLIVTPEEVYNFADFTEDVNPIHKGNNPVVPGLLLGLSAKNEVERTLPSQFCREFKIDFRSKVYAGQKVMRRLPSVKGAYPLEAKVTYHDGATIAAECSFKYHAETARPEKPSGEHQYKVTEHSLWLSREAAICMSLLFGQAPEPDYKKLAIGMLSKVLFEHGRELVEANAQKGKVPAYLTQKFTFPESAPLTQQQVYATAATRQNGNPTRLITKVQMMANDGQPIYSCQAALAFVPNS